MKKGIGIFLLFTVLLLGYSPDAQAQFWKKIFRKDQPKRKTPVRKPAKDKPAQPPKPVTKKKQDVDYPKSEMKQRYRMDVLVPLYLDELVVDGKPVSKGKLPDKAEAGMDFYEGIKLAADTLSTFGYSVDVYIHDITDQGKAPEQLVNKGALDSSDVIIGALQSQQIPAVASFAKRKQINFVSALSPSDADIKGNPYYVLMQPTLKTHCHRVNERIRKKHGNRKPLLLYRNTVDLDKEAYGYLTADKLVEYNELICNALPTKVQLNKYLDSTATNILVISVLENAYIESLLQQLAQLYPNYTFEVYGMPSVRSLSSLRKSDAYPNIAVNFTSPFHFDITTGSGHALSNLYKKEFGSTKPGEMVYRGYETMYWYAYLLNKYGTTFNEKIKDSGVTPFTRYEIQPQWDKDGNLLYLENTHVYLFRYQGGSFSVEQ